MSSPTIPLFTRSLKGWFSAKGFWLVVIAALLPVALTGAWVGTHRADLSANGLEWAQKDVREGQSVHFNGTVHNVGKTDVSGANATLAVGTVVCSRTTTGPNGLPQCVETRFSPEASTDITIDHLAPGASKELTLDWNATPGLKIVVVSSDVSDVIGEIDEFNNEQARAIEVGYALPNASAAPPAPDNLTGTANASVVADLAVESIAFTDEHVTAGKSYNFTATFTNKGPDAIHNATAHVRFSTGFPDQSEALDLAPGESKNVTLTYLPQDGAYWLQAYIVTPSDATDPNGADNVATHAFTSDPKLPPDFQFPIPPEKQTIKEFYGLVLTLYLRLVLPLIALFYAAGVISEERDRRALGYILTKPTPRWVYPITKFAASLIVAAIASAIGVAVTFALLFGTTPQGKEVGYFTTPLLASLWSLFAYGALFTLFGIAFDRPFLAGIAFIAWEFFDVAWNTLGAVVSQVLLVPQMKNVSVAYHLQNALTFWPFDQGLQWAPTTSDGTRALFVLVAEGVAFLALAVYVMKRKEFEL